MSLFDIFKKKETEDLPDDVTTDKVLKGLRRQRRLQKEEMEKQMLRKQIKSYEDTRVKKELYGLGTKTILSGPKLVKAKPKKKNKYLNKGTFGKMSI